MAGHSTPNVSPRAAARWLFFFFLFWQTHLAKHSYLFPASRISALLRAARSLRYLPSRLLSFHPLAPHAPHAPFQSHFLTFTVCFLPILRLFRRLAATHGLKEGCELNTPASKKSQNCTAAPREEIKYFGIWRVAAKFSGKCDFRLQVMDVWWLRTADGHDRFLGLAYWSRDGDLGRAPVRGLSHRRYRTFSRTTVKVCKGGILSWWRVLVLANYGEGWVQVGWSERSTHQQGALNITEAVTAVF